MGFYSGPKPTKKQMEHSDTCDRCRTILVFGSFPRFCDEWYRLVKKSLPADAAFVPAVHRRGPLLH